MKKEYPYLRAAFLESSTSATKNVSKICEAVFGNHDVTEAVPTFVKWVQCIEVPIDAVTYDEDALQVIPSTMIPLEVKSYLDDCIDGVVSAEISDANTPNNTAPRKLNPSKKTLTFTPDENWASNITRTINKLDDQIVISGEYVKESTATLIDTASKDWSRELSEIKSLFTSQIEVLELKIKQLQDDNGNLWRCVTKLSEENWSSHVIKDMPRRCLPAVPGTPRTIAQTRTPSPVPTIDSKLGPSVNKGKPERTTGLRELLYNCQHCDFCTKDPIDLSIQLLVHGIDGFHQQCEPPQEATVSNLLNAPKQPRNYVWKIKSKFRKKTITKMAKI